LYPDYGEEKLYVATQILPPDAGTPAAAVAQDHARSSRVASGRGHPEHGTPPWPPKRGARRDSEPVMTGSAAHLASPWPTMEKGPATSGQQRHDREGMRQLGRGHGGANAGGRT
jgi:hypothetical protein